MQDFFTIRDKALTENGASFQVEINQQHHVFDGHFPGNPVLPGVVSMLMVRRCAENLLGIQSYFNNVKDIKYLQTIIPDGRPLTVNVACADKVVTAEIISADGVAMMKMKGTLA